MGARRVSSDSKAALRWLLYSHEIGGPPQGLLGPWGVLAVPSGMFGCHSSRVDTAEFSWAEAKDTD